MNHANRRILKEYEIKTYCKPLGRPPKEPKSPEYLKKMAKAVGERNEVECSFGTGKRVYRAITSEPSFQKQQNVGQECATLSRT